MLLQMRSGASLSVGNVQINGGIVIFNGAKNDKNYNLNHCKNDRDVVPYVGVNAEVCV